MRIVTLKLKNIRCWYDEHIFNLNKYTAFIGENSTGKSALQDVIYYGLLNPTISVDFVSRNTYSNSNISLKLSFSNKEIQFFVQELQKEIPREEDLTYLLNRNIDLWNHLVVKRKKLSNVALTVNEHLVLYIVNQYKLEVESYDQYIRTLVKREISTYQPVIDHIAYNLKLQIQNHLKNSIVRLPSLRKLSNSESVTTSASFSTYHDGKNLRGLLFNAKNSREISSRYRFEIFQEIVQNWSFTPGRPELLAKTAENVDLFFVDQNENQYKIEEVGDGIKEAVIIAGISILQPDRIILIEEPELHLHPRALRELRELLKHELTGQVIISTHNPVFVNEIDDNSTIFKIVKKAQKSKAIEIKNKEDLLNFRREFGLFNSDFLFEDILVFVEGKIDVQVFSSWFEILYPEDMSVRFISMGGKGDVSSTIALSLVLQLDQSFNYFVILDKDEETKEEIENKIITSLKGKIPKLLEEIGEEVLKEKIIVLSRKNLEEYFDKATRIFAELLKIDEKEVIEFFEKSSMSLNRKLRRLFYKYGKGNYKIFKKSKHIPLIAEKLKKEDISGEIIKIFQLFKTK